MLGDINAVINEMAATSDFKDGWAKIEITVAQNNIITLGWPAWKLKICSFKLSPATLVQAKNVADIALEIETLDTLYEQGDTFIWRTNKNANENDWDQQKRAKVVDVVDAFLEGTWTPPWKCGHCVARASGKYIPRF
jgi:hypothetical protein